MTIGKTHPRLYLLKKGFFVSVIKWFFPVHVSLSIILIATVINYLKNSNDVLDIINDHPGYNLWLENSYIFEPKSESFCQNKFPFESKIFTIINKYSILTHTSMITAEVKSCIFFAPTATEPFVQTESREIECQLNGNSYELIWILYLTFYLSWLSL